MVGNPGIEDSSDSSSFIEDDHRKVCEDLVKTLLLRLVQSDKVNRREVLEKLSGTRDCAVYYLLGLLTEERFLLNDYGEWKIVSIQRNRKRSRIQGIFSLQTFKEGGRDRQSSLISYSNKVKRYDTKLKLEIIWLLGELRERRAINPLIKELNSSYKIIQKEAASALKKIGEPAVPRLIESLRESTETVRKLVEDVIIKIGAPATPHLINSLNTNQDKDKDKDKGFRGVIIYLLGEIQDPSAIEVLIKTLKESNEAVRDKTEGALIKIGRPTIKPLTEELGKVNYLNTKIRICRIFGEIGDLEAVKPLIHLIENEDNRKLLRQTEDALVKIGGPEAEKSLKKYRKDISNKGKDQWREYAKKKKQEIFR